MKDMPEIPDSAGGDDEVRGKVITGPELDALNVEIDRKNEAHHLERMSQLPALKEEAHRKRKEPFSLEKVLEVEDIDRNGPLTQRQIEELELDYYDDVNPGRLTVKAWVNWRLANDLGLI